MNFNENLPEWKNTGTEPSDELKTNGFQAGYKPPANIFNWFWSKVSKAITELQTKLSNVDNTSDMDKPISTATQTVLDNKVDKDELIQKNNLTIRGKLTEAKWHRIAKYEASSTAEVIGKRANSCEIILKRNYDSYKSEFHHILFNSASSDYKFTSLADHSANNKIEQIRLVIDGKNAYIDIKSSTSSDMDIQVIIQNGIDSSEAYWQPVFELITADVAAANVKCTYNIPAKAYLLNDTMLTDTPTDDNSKVASSKCVYDALNEKTSIETASGYTRVSVDDDDGAVIYASGRDVFIDHTSEDSTINTIRMNNSGTNIDSSFSVQISGGESGEKSRLELGSLNARIIAPSTIDFSATDVTVNSKKILTADNLTDTYSSTSSQAMSGKAVASAISGVTKSTIGLGNVDNTADTDKPISTATQTALDGKANKADLDNTIQYYSSNEIKWIRVAEFIGENNNQTTGTICNSCEIVIGRDYYNTNNEYHHLYFSGINNNRKFSSINNLSNNQIIDKIRYVVVDENGTKKSYIDVHYNGTVYNRFFIKLLNIKNYLFKWKNVSIPLDNNDITGQIVYNIPANSELAQKTDIPTVSDTYSDTSTQAMSGKAVASAISGVTKSTVGLGNVDNTADVDKPISTATQEALDEKAYGMKKVFTPTTQGWYRVATVNYAPTNSSAIFLVNQPWGNLQGDGFIVSICSRHDSPPDMIQLGRACRGDANTFPKCRCVYGWDKVYFDIYYNYNITNDITINSFSAGFLLNDITYLGNEDTSGVDDGYNTKVFELARQGIKADVITSPSLDLKADKIETVTDIDSFYPSGKGVRFGFVDTSEMSGYIISVRSDVLAKQWYFSVNDSFAHIKYREIWLTGSTPDVGEWQENNAMEIGDQKQYTLSAYSASVDYIFSDGTTHADVKIISCTNGSTAACVGTMCDVANNKIWFFKPQGVTSAASLNITYQVVEF